MELSQNIVTLALLPKKARLVADLIRGKKVAKH